ncbi:MAG TPA: hypothetical protein PLZ58_00035 [Candidatus Saccharibacteria bacterium]|nr:hypothetical protein [Candidatus Saccharibacteria bacterium]HRQ07289.1 hypothetical protein [Candidatus Saccharibacteria bacterium]
MADQNNNDTHHKKTRPLDDSQHSGWGSMVGLIVFGILWCGLVWLFLNWLGHWMLDSNVALFRGLGVLVMFGSIFITYLIFYQGSMMEPRKELARQRANGQVPLLSTLQSTLVFILYILWVPAIIFAIVTGVNAYTYIHSDNTDSSYVSPESR